MTSTPDTADSHILPFLSLPYEVRREIYHWALDWPDVRPSFARLSRECKNARKEMEASPDPKCTFPILHVGRLTTPTMLLLNRQITYEALLVLQTKPLILHEAPPFTPCTGRPMDITEFIGEETLQRVRRVVLKMDLEIGAASWGRTIDTLLDVWCVKNNLEEILVDITAAYLERRRIIGEELSRQYAALLISKVRPPNAG